MGKTTIIGGDITKIETNGKEVDVNNPLPDDGDSVYSKDVWKEFSTNVNFTGTVTDLFDDLHSQMINNSSDPIKTLFIHFNRTIISNSIGLGSAVSGDFSNVKIDIINSGGVATTVVDESGINNKETSKQYPLPITAGFNAIKITFNTTDTITLSNCVILKAIGVVARLQARKPDNTITDINATTGGNLKVSIEEQDPGAGLATSAKQDDIIAALGGVVSYAKAYLIDSSDKYIAYSAQAVIASATSASVWRIKRITSTVTGNAVVHWADGNDSFDNILDNREVLSYS